MKKVQKKVPNKQPFGSYPLYKCQRKPYTDTTLIAESDPVKLSVRVRKKRELGTIPLPPVTVLSILLNKRLPSAEET